MQPAGQVTRIDAPEGAQEVSALELTGGLIGHSETLATCPTVQNHTQNPKTLAQNKVPFAVERISAVRMINRSTVPCQLSVKWIDPNTARVSEEYLDRPPYYLTPGWQMNKFLYEPGVPDGSIVQFPLSVQNRAAAESGIYFIADKAAKREVVWAIEGGNPVIFKYEGINSY